MIPSGARFDAVVVGGGIVGLAVARALLMERPSLRLALLEREAEVGRHQTGHNSGVIHSGLYYRPGSLKARLCVEGGRELHRFCEEHGIPHPAVGKLVVATTPAEAARLDALEARGRANGVTGIRRLDAVGLREVEPEAGGLEALHVAATAITDYGAVARALAGEVAERGGRVLTGAGVGRVRALSDGLLLETSAGEVRAAFALTCAGLWADRVARAFGVDPKVRILAFRGEYRRLAPAAAARVRGLVYPVPDPSLPFLGVHLTRTVAGEVEVGPNAVWTLARAGYRRGLPPARDAWEALSYPGLWRLGRHHLGSAAFEFARSLSPRLFAASARRLMPSLADADLLPGGAGVRAQAVTPAGELVDDFLLRPGPRSLHVLNAPSPAATASLAIGRHVAQRALAMMAP
jgi:L-2-hydroxyglutarate oxidase